MNAILLSLILTLGSPTLPPITGSGACGGPAYGPNVYVFTYGTTTDPHGALYDVSAVPDFSWGNMGITLNATTWTASTTENVGPTIWLRWTSQPSIVYRINAVKCGTVKLRAWRVPVPPRKGMW